MRKPSKHQRAPIELVDDKPMLRGYPILSYELLETRSGGKWVRVFLDRSRDKAKHWVLRLVDDPDNTTLARGSLARRVAIHWRESTEVIEKAREKMTPISKTIRRQRSSKAGSPTIAIPSALPTPSDIDSTDES